MIAFFNYFVKITGWLVQAIIFRTKVFYENKKIQSRRIKGPAIAVSNHTSVYDYAVYLFVFFFRTIRCQMAEVLYKKRLLRLFLKCMGGIYVNRDSHDFFCLDKSNEILKKKGLVLIFPEGRLPLPEEERPLPFQPGAAMLALMSNAPIIPVYTSGGYFKKSRVKVIIGTPIYANDLIDNSLSDKDNIDIVCKTIRDKIIGLGKLLDEKK